jgi:phage recombination protein Bet
MAAQDGARQSLVVRMAGKFGVDPDKMLATLKATAFRTEKVEVTNEQMMALLVVADQYNLNPWTREIYAFVDSRTGGIVPVIGVDGWVRMINQHPAIQSGPTFKYPDGFADEPGELAAWIECTIARRDRGEPTTIREYMAECRRDTTPWNTHPNRMLRHKALIQCARYAFGFAGVSDPDEAERIMEAAGRTFEHEPTPRPLPRATEPDKPALATTDQLNAISAAIVTAGEARNNCAQVLSDLRDHFSVKELTELTFERVPEVLAWLRAR